MQEFQTEKQILAYAKYARKLIYRLSDQKAKAELLRQLKEATENEIAKIS